MDPRTDCRYYLGEKPCSMKRRCSGCPHYQTRGISVVILKLGAMGDALRTTPLLHAVKRKFPVSYVTWITDTESVPVLQNNPLIDELIINKPEAVLPLMARQFDLLVCLDKAPSVTSLAVLLSAHERKGFSMTRYGTLDVLNETSAYALALGIDDELKFCLNNKTYQQIVYEMAELPYIQDEYIYVLPPESECQAQHIIDSLRLPGNGPKIGLNTGCGDVFATKKWPDRHFITLTQLLRKHLDARVYLLGGPAEMDSNARIESETSQNAVNTGCHSIPVFAGVLKQMDAIVTGDTMALHLALAVKTPVTGLFGSTCYQEIDFYGIGEPVVVKRDCSPCYRQKCRHTTSCMATLKPLTVIDSVKKILHREN